MPSASRFEIAQYLVNLHTLMEAQDDVGLIKSSLLADEYNKHWGLLRTAIEKENDNERKDIRNKGDLNEGRANPARDQPGRSEPDRQYGRPESYTTR